jgi:hypothetical protein
VTSHPGGDFALAAALHDLRQTIADTRSALARVQAVPTTTPDERRELQREALTGSLGEDMQRLARHVEAGETSWAEVFEGDSPYTDLLRDHFDRMVATHAESVRRSIEADPEFDPQAPHEDP